MNRIPTCSRGGKTVRWHVAGVSERSKRDFPPRRNGEKSDGSVPQGNPEPCLGRQLQSAHHEITNDVRVTDDDFRRIFFLTKMEIESGHENYIPASYVWSIFLWKTSSDARRT